MKFSLHIYCTEMHPKKLMVYGFTINKTVKRLQIFSAGIDGWKFKFHAYKMHFLILFFVITLL